MRTQRPRAMVVAGVMSGTSADGVDVALARIQPGAGGVPTMKVLGWTGFAYPRSVRAAVLQAASGEMKVAELSRLHWRLGEVYAGCVEKACAAAGVKAELIGMHGQTVYHEAHRATWQMGEAAVVRERLDVPVVSDFRPADLAAGGQAAPLVPMLDYCMFRSKTKNRLLLNLGGIANVTLIPRGAGLAEMMAFDTGPANMVVDALMAQLYGRGFDRGGRVAAKGRVLQEVVAQILRERYFSVTPPKSCGREQFGAAFAERVAAVCARAGGDKADVIGTASEVTVASIVAAYQRFCAPALRGGATEVIAAGGGTLNAWLMRRLREEFAAVDAELTTVDAWVPAQAKEAVAFALLAWLSWHGLPGNVPAATGARRAVVLGKVTC